MEHDVLVKDQEIQSLQHKLSVTEADLEKAESSLKDHKSAKEESSAHKDTNESLNRKIALLEEELDNAEKNLRETTDKYVCQRGRKGPFQQRTPHHHTEYGYVHYFPADFVKWMSKQSISSDKSRV